MEGLQGNQTVDPGHPNVGEQKPEPKGPTQADIDRLKSIKDSELAQERQARLRAEGALSELVTQYEAVVGVLQSTDPDKMSQAIAKAKQDEKDKKLEALEAKEEERAQWEGFYWRHTNAAVGAGIDPNDPRYQSAIKNAWLARNEAGIAQTLGALVAEKVKAEASKPAPREPEQEEAEYAPPPGGGGSPRFSQDDVEALAGKIIALSNEPTKNAGEIARLKEQLKKMKG